MEYLYSPKIHEKIRQNKIEIVEIEQKYNLEKIIALMPVAIFTNYVPSFQNTYQTLQNKGIEVIFIDEFSDKTSLNKAKLITIFGSLKGEKKKADSIHSSIEEKYLEISNLAKKTRVFVNEIFGYLWFIRQSNTSISQIMKDTGGDYFLVI